MLTGLRRWIERPRQNRRRWQADARYLIARDEVRAYYEAQRQAARARAVGDGGNFFHWSKVAAEIARISPQAEMDIAVVQAIVDAELAVRRKGWPPSLPGKGRA
jgi:hypothetical protein